VTTDTTIELETPDGPMPAFQSEPDGRPQAAIVVIQEAFGITDHIRRVTRQVAEAGYLAVAPALFHRQGSPELDYDDFEAIKPVMGTLTKDGIAMDLATTFQHLTAAGYPGARQGIVGFCMGGSVTLFAAATFPLGAAVTYYGGGVATGRFGFPPLIELAPQLQTPWLGHFGDLDQGIPVEDVEQLRAAAAQAPVPNQIVRHPDADHGFNCEDRPKVHNPIAAASAWSTTMEWFNGYLKK
jgi:carboxymethylenebutenolidase